MVLKAFSGSGYPGIISRASQEGKLMLDGAKDKDGVAPQIGSGLQHPEGL